MIGQFTMKGWLIYATLLLSFETSAQVLIFTYAYNQPDFIELQYKTFKRFLLDDYEFIVFNDAAEISMKNNIQKICKKYNIRCIDIPQEIHDRPYLSRYDTLPYHSPMARNSNVVQYSLDVLGLHHNEIVALFDSDLFLIKEFSIRNFLKEYHLAGFNRPCYDLPHPIHNCKRDHPNTPPIEYLWIGLIFIDMSTLPYKFHFNVNDTILNSYRIDPGGNTYYSLQYPGIKSKFISRINLNTLKCKACVKIESNICSHHLLKLMNLGFNEPTIQLMQEIPICTTGIIQRDMEFFLNDTFIHYKAGTNWNNASRQLLVQKRKIFDRFINNIMIDN